MQPQRSYIVLSWPEGEESRSVWLDTHCGECSGSGRVPNQAWEEWQQEYEQALKGLGPGAKELPAEDIVPYPEDGEELTCEECEGRGTVPTKAGQSILDLVYRYQTQAVLAHHHLSRR